LLVAFRPTIETSIHPFGNRVSLSALVGLSLTRDYWTLGGSDTPLYTQSFNGVDFTTFARSGAHGVMAGPGVEIAVGRLSAELDAVYRVYRQHFHVAAPNGRVGADQVGNTATWEFPVLAKYRLATRRAAQPFVEGGPSFRIPGTVSHFGVTAGAGLALRSHHLQFAPTLRYTRWIDDRSGTQPNAIQMLLRVSF
jgi:hypothetical protein